MDDGLGRQASLNSHNHWRKTKTIAFAVQTDTPPIVVRLRQFGQGEGLASLLQIEGNLQGFDLWCEGLQCPRLHAGAPILSAEVEFDLIAPRLKLAHRWQSHPDLLVGKEIASRGNGRSREHNAVQQNLESNV